MKRAILDSYSGPWTPGLDVSAYQPDVVWPLVARSELLVGKAGAKAGMRRSIGRPLFAIVRSGDGVQTRSRSAADPWAVRHLAGAAGAGLLVDVYHYVRAWHFAEDQVAVILDVLRVSGARVRRVWLDVEGRDDDPRTVADEGKGAWWAPKGTPPEERPTTEDVLDCLARMSVLLVDEALDVGIYTGVAWHERMAMRRVDDALVWADAPLWTPYYTRGARYRMPAAPGRDGRAEPWPWDHAEIWQCAGGGAGVDATIAGIAGPVDANLYRGDEAALRAWWDPRARPGC